MSKRALAHLREVDPILARLIARVGPYPRMRRRAEPHFDAVVRAIVYQQLSGKAARTILGRVLDLFGGRTPTPAEILASTDERLRGAGLSRQKLGYFRDLAGKAASGEVPFDNLHELGDQEVIDALVRIKGVGTWTAQMFLMFQLARPDVLPLGDLGLQNAIRRAYRLRRRPTAAQIEKIGAPWHPHATAACWYLWRSLELE